MAKLTPTALMNAMGANGNNERIIRTLDGATTDQHLVVGGARHPGRTRWCTVTHANGTATQISTIASTLTDGY